MKAAVHHRYGPAGVVAVEEVPTPVAETGANVTDLRPGDRIRLESTNQDSLITDVPMTHFYGTKAGADTCHRDRSHPSTCACTSVPAPERSPP